MLSIKNLHFGYSKTNEILKGIDLSLNSSEIGVILGANGAGKSTLLKNILGLLKPSLGEITIDNEDMINIKPKLRAQKIAYVSQNVELPNLSVYETILMARLPYYALAPSKEDKDIVLDIIREFDLEQFMNKMSTELSGGEKQIVAIARALSQQPDLLVFDEPTSNLDISRSLLLEEKIKKVAKEKNIAVIMAVHDLDIAYDIADKFYFMNKGEIVASGGKEVFTEENIYKTFEQKCTIKNIDGTTYIKFERK